MDSTDGNNGEAGPEGFPPVPGYKLVRRLGAGGTGAVYLAETTGSGAPASVAIKVLRAAGLPVLLVDRLRRECRALARLDHPHIARFLASGETGDGEPFIVMQFVQGRTLRQWIDEDSPPLAARLEIFMQAASAVAHAHQNLVVHRDITPENVLVTDAGQAMLIDFGVALPDQAGAGHASTLSDIHSLGLLLQELVAGAGEAELNAIAAKASAGRPADRFGSASDLIGQIEDFRTRKPVESYSDTAGYRVAKFLSRERVLVGSIAAAVAAVLIALAAIGLFFGSATTAHEPATFSGAREVVRYQLFDLDPQLARQPGKAQARLALAEQSERYLAGLAQSRTGDAQVQVEIAEGYIQLAHIQGVPGQPNLGVMAKPREHLVRADQILAPLVRAGHVSAQIAKSRLESDRAQLLALMDGDLQAARDALDQSQSVLDQVPASARDWSWMDARRYLHAANLAWADLAHDMAAIALHAAALERDQQHWPESRVQGFEGQLDRTLAAHYRAIIAHEAQDAAGFRRALVQYQLADERLLRLEQDYPGDPQLLYWRGWNGYFGYSAAASLGREAQASAFLAHARTALSQLVELAETDRRITDLHAHIMAVDEGQALDGSRKVPPASQAL